MADPVRPPNFFQQTPAQERSMDILDPYGRYPANYGAARTEQDYAEERADQAARLNQRRAQFQIIDRILPTVGRVVVPRSNTFTAYKRLYDSNLYDIHFSAYDYGAFDAVVEQKYGKDSFSNSDNDYHEESNELRRNLGIVRSYMAAHYFPDGRFDDDDKVETEDMKNAERMQSMAGWLGRAMWVSRLPLFGNSLSKLMFGLDMKQANERNKGSVAIYEALLTLEKRTGWLKPWTWGRKQEQGEWKLAPLEESPFSEENMRIQALNLDPWQPGVQQSLGGEMLNIAFRMDEVAKRLKKPQELPAPTLERSIELAREILDKFRIIGGNSPRNSALAINDADELPQMQRILDLAFVYEDYAAQLARANPAALRDPAIEAGRQALRRMSYLIKLQAFEELQKEGHVDEMQIMAEVLKRTPNQNRVYKNEGQNFQTLITQLEAGLETMGRAVGAPPRRAKTPGAGLGQAQQLGNDLNSTTQQAQITQASNNPEARRIAEQANQQNQQQQRNTPGPDQPPRDLPR